jgi:aminocarboxymuconate-semialdehyde decarboxylase
LAIPWARAFNDALADLIVQYPRRFLGLGQVALQAPGAAVDELLRIMRDPGFAGVEITTRVGDRNLDEVETTIAAISLICGGVLDRHPGLNVCLVHGGGTLPYQIGRIGHAHHVNPGSVGSLPAPPGTYLRRFHFDTVTHSAEVLAFLRDLVGSDRLVLGSDYPFAMGCADPVGELDKGDLVGHGPGEDPRWQRRNTSREPEEAVVANDCPPLPHLIAVGQRDSGP